MDVIKWITGTVTEGSDVVICEQVLMGGTAEERGREWRRDEEGKEGSQREGGMIFFSVIPSQ